MSKKTTIDDIFNDDDFGILNSPTPKYNSKTEDERLIDSFEEINVFVDSNKKEPGTGSMSEYRLSANLKTFREEKNKKKALKPYDRHNLLGTVEIDRQSIDDILNEDDELLKTDEELSIFKYTHIPKPDDRADSDFVAQRKPMREKEFKLYEQMFQKVHIEIKNGKRQIRPFTNIEKNLHIGNFYIMDGLLLYLESADLDKEIIELKSGDRFRTDGRTRTIFENGTYSNMLYRSLGKQIQKNGKLITNLNDNIQDELFIDSGQVKEEDIQTGWIYILKSKSADPNITNIEDLYKIGFSSTPVEQRIKNASKEATYLFSDVKIVATYSCYNRNADKLEQLLHRFFANSCLNVDLFDDKGQRITPREWFVVPLKIIEKAIEMILNESIINFKYDKQNKQIVQK